MEYYAKCAIGGALSCGLTHTAVVPLDLVKCRMQVDGAKYKNISTGFKVSIAEEGARGLAKGWAPTLIGYSIQGLGKFGFYEAFKHFYSGLLGEVKNLFNLIDFFRINSKLIPNSKKKRKTLIFTVLHCTWLLVPVLSSLPILVWLHLRLSRLEFKPSQDLPTHSEKDSPR